MAQINHVLGIDVGTKKIGVARVNMLARLPEPIDIIEADGAEALIKQLVAGHDIDAVVIGLPRGLDGQETEQTLAVRTWAKSLRKSLALPMFWQDEALTSELAKEYIQKHNITPHLIDAVSACIILEDFMYTPEASRVTV